MLPLTPGPSPHPGARGANALLTVTKNTNSSPRPQRGRGVGGEGETHAQTPQHGTPKTEQKTLTLCVSLRDFAASRDTPQLQAIPHGLGVVTRTQLHRSRAGSPSGIHSCLFVSIRGSKPPPPASPWRLSAASRCAAETSAEVVDRRVSLDRGHNLQIGLPMLKTTAIQNEGAASQFA